MPVTLWAAADLGSNTFRLLVAQEARDGRLRQLELHQEVVRLAQGLEPGGRLAPAAVARAGAVLDRFRARLDRLGVARRVGVLAAAGRLAGDGAAFAREAGRRLDGAVRVVGGREEAALSARGMVSLVEPPERLVLCLDIGGGSTELAAVEEGRIVAGQSLPVGVVSLWEAAGVSDPPDPSERRAMASKVARVLDGLAAAVRPRSWRERFRAGKAALVATAGTPLTVAAGRSGLSPGDTRRLSGSWVGRGALVQEADRLWALSTRERAALPHVVDGREDVILPGVTLLAAVVDGAGARGFTVSDGGLLEGALLAAVARVRGRARWEPAGSRQTQTRG